MATAQAYGFNSAGAIKEPKDFFPVVLAHAELVAATWLEVVEATNADPLVLRDIAYYNQSGGGSDLYLAIVPPGSAFSDVGTYAQVDVILLNPDAAVATLRGWRERDAQVAIPALNRVLVYATGEGNIHMSGWQLTL